MKKVLIICSLFIVVSTVKLYSFAYLSLLPAFQIHSMSFQNNLNPTRQQYLDFLGSPKLITAGINARVKGWYFNFQLELAQNFHTYLENNYYINIFADSEKGFAFRNLLVNIPLFGYIEYKNDYFRFIIGRTRVDLGYGDYNFILSDYAPPQDIIWLSADPWHNDANFVVKPFFNFIIDMSPIHGNEIYLSDTNNNPNGRYRSFAKTYNVHQIGVYNDYFRIVLTEVLMVYGAEFSLATISPIAWWHQSFLNNANNMTSVSLEGKIGNYRLYAEGSFDDLYIGKEDDTSKPNAMGFVIGFDVQLLEGEPFLGVNRSAVDNTVRADSFRKETGLIVGFETVISSKYMYDRPSSDPFGKMSFFQSYQTANQTLNDKWSLIEYYLGFPYGGETLYAFGKLKYVNRNWFVNSQIGYMFWGGNKGTGVYAYDSDDLKMQDAIDGNGYKRWFNFENPKHSIIVEAEAFYAADRWWHLYAGVNANIVANDIKRTTWSFSLGGGFYVNSAWFTKSTNTNSAISF